MGNNSHNNNHPSTNSFGANPSTAPGASHQTKFCKYCGKTIDKGAVLCVYCGKQVEELKGGAAPQVVIHNSNSNTNTNMNANTNFGGGVPMGRPKDKVVALLLCFFLGYLGVHRFYEGKIGTGILYLFTVGLFGVGIVIDFIILLFKPNPYYV